ncbi:hypothetical protein O9929_08745 [Vibrio lentus]|nr:hypothetical protein [Vibrio lentus]
MAPSDENECRQMYTQAITHRSELPFVTLVVMAWYRDSK